MTASAGLVLADHQVAADLRTFVARARTAEDGAVRLQASGTVLAAYVCILRPRALGEATPTVLGLRTMPLAVPLMLDTTVSLASMSDRLARMAANDVILSVPPTTVTESWTGVLPPRSGWEAHGALDPGRLEETAREGIREVARTVPNSPGVLVVNNARGIIWGRPLPGPAVTVPAVTVPAGSAFAAFALGFLVEDEPPAVFTNGRWTRISTSRGHILARAAAVL